MHGLSLRSIGRLALDLVYPPRCAVCGKGGGFLCDQCTADLPYTRGARCDRCWLPLRGPACDNCSTHPWRLERLRAALRYDGEAARLVRAYKFGGQSSLAPALGVLLAEAWQTHPELHASVIVPVPLTASRERLRGYNQARLLAAELASATGAAMVDALRRSGPAAAQALSASADERRRNVQGVFSLKDGVDLTRATVLLIDDVATTGATLNACAAVLLSAGVERVNALTLAREDA